MRNFGKLRKKTGLLTTATLLGAQMLFASTTDTPDKLIEDWGKTITDTLNAAVLVFALVGGFIIFIQYMQGNESAQKNFIKFIIGLAIFGMVGGIANVFIDGTAAAASSS